MASNVLPLFWNLASSSKDTRLSASCELVSSLEGFQQSFLASKVDAEPSSDDDDDDEEGNDGENDEDDDESGMEVDGDDNEGGPEDDEEAAKLDKTFVSDNAEDVVYTIRRLIRGLGSSRESSRLGFSVALTEILSRIPSVTASQAITLLIRSTPYSQGMKGSDERDALFARLFGLSAIVQSGALFNPATSDPADVRIVISHLIELGQAKAWLRESAWWTVIGAVERLLSSETSWREEALVALIGSVLGEQGWTQEKVALALILERRRPDLDSKSLFGSTFRHTPLLASANLVALGRILKETDSDDDETGAASTSTGSWKPQLHFVWTVILDSYFAKGPTEGAYPPGQAPFQDFFRVLVDESLFANTSSSERKFWGFQVFERALPVIPSDLVPQIFTANFMRCWMNNLSSSDRYLHKVAVQIAHQVQGIVKSNPSVGFTLLATLVGKHGRPDFDRVTKTKTVESIMGSLNGKGVMDYVKYLQQVILSTEFQNGEDVAAIENRRLWALDQLLALCRNGSLPKEDDCIEFILDFLLIHGFFALKKHNKKSPVPALHTLAHPPLSDKSAAVCRARFFSCIIELTTASPKTHTDVTQPSRQHGCDSLGKLWLQHSLELMQALEGDSKHVEMLLEADEEIHASRQAALATISSLRKASDSQLDVARGVEILLSLILLQTYDETEDALDMLEEIDSAARQMFKLPTAKASSSTGPSQDRENSPADALLDVLITLLDKASNDLRNLANLVFGSIASAFTSASLRHLIAQLEQSIASAAADDDNESELDGEPDDEEDDDSEEDSESDSSDSDAVSEEDERDDTIPVDPAFRQRVAEALQISGMAANGDAEEDDSKDESEEVWDDEQMMKVDEQLAEVFRQQANTNKRSDLKHLQTESLHFKNRVLDFFEVYARRQSHNPLILDIILPLLNLVRSSGSSEGDLANKAAGILRTRLGKAKAVPASLPTENASSTLTAIHDMAQKAPSADFSGLCSTCSLFIVRSLETSASTSPSNPATEAYRATLADFMTRKSSAVHPAFLNDYIRRYSVQAWSLRTDICDYVTSATSVNAYRQTQAYNMLQTLSQQLGPIAKAVGSDQVRDFVKRASGDVLDTLESAADTNSDWNAARLKEVVKFALQLARTSRSALPQMAIGDIWDMQRLAEVTRKVREGERTKDMKSVHGLLQQLAAVLAAKSERKDKRTEAVVNGDAMQANGTNTAQFSSNPLKSNLPPPSGGLGKVEKLHKLTKTGDGIKVNGTQVNGTSMVNGDDDVAKKKEKKRKIEEGRGVKRTPGAEASTEKGSLSAKKHKSSSKSS